MKRYFIPVNEMAQRARRVLAEIWIPLSLAICLKLASLLQHHYVIGWSKPMEVPALENAQIFIWAALVSFLPRKAQAWFGGLLLVVTQFIMLVDATYYRFFYDVPSLHLLPTWFQTGRIGASVATVFRAVDLLLLVPIVCFAILAFWARRKNSPSEKRSLRAACGLFIFAFIFASYSWSSLHPVRYIQLQRRFQNKAIQKLFGPQFYHYYDFFEWSRVTLGLEGGRELDSALVKSVIGQSREMSLADTPFRGRYEGRDFVFVQLESLEYFALDAEYDGKPIMPFLYQAQERVFRFRLFDQTHLGRSADGQFIFLNSLHPPAARPLPFVYPNNSYYGIPKLFTELGYQSFYFEPVESSFWNAGTIAKAYGFQHLFFRDELPPQDRKKDVRGWGLTDRALYEHVMTSINECDDPFFMYVITVMCHHPYSETSNVPVDFPPKKVTSQVRRYLRCVAARDQAIRDFMMELSTTERGRKTVFCLAGDHDANLSRSEMNKLGYPIAPEREAIPVLIGSVEEFLGLDDGERPVPPRDFGGQMDLAPSLGHVFSLNMEESVFVGWNLFATQNRGPHYCRLGTWMDQTGRIQEAESEKNTTESPLFKVSEMLLQGDKIRDFQVSF